ncbi:hypothetical protein AC739_16350 [Planococcus glaciei]|nr:hypothetical protein AC739_16350 [Planococcus glaciei]
MWKHEFFRWNLFKINNAAHKEAIFLGAAFFWSFASINRKEINNTSIIFKVFNFFHIEAYK